jgi:CubicO group peptidase (beta-lactamase class C family)
MKGVVKLLVSLAVVELTSSLVVSGAAHSAPTTADPQFAAIGPLSEVPVALQNLRWLMLDPHINALTFRSMDALFTTRTVARSGPVTPLPRADHPLDFTYSFRDRTYKGEAFLDRTQTNALLLMKDGRILYETYRNNTDERTRFIGWSATKSVVSVLIGCALEEGKIGSLDDDIVSYLPELKGGGYDGVTIRQILMMRSGVDYEERYDFHNPGTAARNHILALVKNVSRFADIATSIPRLHPPGEVFAYKTLDTAVLGWLIERVSGGSLSAYMTEHLWEPLGAEADGFFVMDGPPGVGREFSGAGFNGTLRDFARFGQMMLNGGRINGREIVSSDWVNESTRSTGPVDPVRGGYGYHWWTMTDGHAYAAIGLQGQFIYIDPATRTVIVKFSYFPPGDESGHEESLAFFAAASAWRP